jgi:hypothetical protein
MHQTKIRLFETAFLGFGEFDGNRFGYPGTVPVAMPDDVFIFRFIRSGSIIHFLLSDAYSTG